jgi:predicted NBD/HSP70 family sugar kinase
MTPPRGSNLPAIGTYNQSVVLDAIRRAGAMSRVELAQRTGLTAQTVGTLSRRLIEEGLIRESDRVNIGPGKPRRLLTLRPGGRYAVGVHIDPAVLTFVLLDLEGTIVAHASLPTPTGRPERIIAAIADEVARLVNGSEVDPTRILGLGVAAPGPIDVRAGVILEPPILPQWRNLPLRGALQASTGMSVLLDKDVIAAAVAERWISSGARGGGHDRPDVAFIYYGTGLGAGLVINGEPVAGPGATAGNIGHITVDDHGPVCSCGRVGCLASLITPQALVLESISRGVIAQPAKAVDEKIDPESVVLPFRELVGLADDGDPEAKDVFRGVAHHLAQAVVLIASILNIDDIVVGGPFWSAIAPHVMEPLRTGATTSRALILRRPLRITESVVGEDVTAVGAACLVLDTAMSPRPTNLLIAPVESAGA